ncbi:hypothetical protein F4804DRAFT_135739 [Jackrogersella minutella]|nr:hypothetical protein F4804DRAFT_135739 [Jackrogersella minutella]
MLQLTFLMLDPDPGRRITARQLTDLLNRLRSNHFSSINQLACDECRRTSSVPMHNIPLHSVFKVAPGGGTYIPSKEHLSADTPDL